MGRHIWITRHTPVPLSTGLPLQHIDKDYTLIAELAAEAGVPMPATATAGLERSSDFG